MNPHRVVQISLSVLAIGTALTAALPAQDNPPASGSSPTPAAQPSEAEMMELAKPGEPHRLLAQLVGKWGYTVKFSMTPGSEPAEAGQGTAVRRPIMDGRYFTVDVIGKMLMPGADGKMANTEFKGMSVEGYDNVKQKFVSTWIDSMGTSIVLSEGTYDASTKSFTYLMEMELAPGTKTKAREVVKVLDADHYQMDWHENHGGRDFKTMEIDYARQK